MLDDRARSRLARTRFSDVRWFATIGSTNTWVLDQARSGAPEGLVAVADEQTAGRGRLGRRWHAPSGSSLLCSLLLRPVTLPADRRHLTTVAVAVAAAEACEEVAGFAPELKWPNDLLVGTRKLAGVLAEAEGDAVVVGIGVNLNWPPDLPADLSSVAVAANHVTGREVDRRAFLVRLLEGVERWYGRWDELASEHRRRCATLGRTVRVELADETFSGDALDVSPEGHLLVDVGACIRTVVAGDVVHLRAQA